MLARCFIQLVSLQREPDQIPDGAQPAGQGMARGTQDHGAGRGMGLIGLLRFPGHDAALDVDLPAASAGAVHAVSRAHNLVVLPSLAITLLPHPIFVAQFTEAISKRLSASSEIGETFEKMTHETAPNLVCAAEAPAGIASPITGKRRTSVV